MKKAMWKAWSFIQDLKHKDDGQGMVEYGLIIALIAVVAIVALVAVGGKVSNLFTNVASNL